MAIVKTESIWFIGSVMGVEIPEGARALTKEIKLSVYAHHKEMGNKAKKIEKIGEGLQKAINPLPEDEFVELTIKMLEIIDKIVEEITEKNKGMEV